ncbi:MAG TPA: YciI family protein [Ornithinibacter sp.]|nr:YciI family protein [Ornithinibacter sp.]
MTTYVILLPGDESSWEAATPDERAAVFAEHDRFSRTLEEHGHRVVGGAELAHSRTARTVRAGDGGLVVSDGPYAESVEQLTGFYLVESDDLDDLLAVCGILAAMSDTIEVRACLPAPDVEPDPQAEPGR